MESEKVEELAETLKKQGLAASMYEAIEKAKLILEDEEEIEKMDEERLREGQEAKTGVEGQRESSFEKLRSSSKKLRGYSLENENSRGTSETPKRTQSFFAKLKDKIQHKEHKDIKRFEEPGYDVSKEEVTVSELMEEIGVNPDEVREMEKEKIEEETEILKEKVEDEKKKGRKEKIEELKEEVSEVKEEFEEFEEEK